MGLTFSEEHAAWDKTTRDGKTVTTQYDKLPALRNRCNLLPIPVISRLTNDLCRYSRFNLVGNRSVHTYFK